MEDNVRITIPPSPEYVAVIRLAIGSLAREAGLDPERTHDLKIAISEVCTDSINAARAAGVDGAISLAWKGSASALSVDVASPMPVEPAVEASDTSPRLSFSRALLEALLDSYTVEPAETGSIAHLSIAL